MHLIERNQSLIIRDICKYNRNPLHDISALYHPVRFPGRPCMKWDDNLHHFCNWMWPDFNAFHWMEVLDVLRMSDGLGDLEDTYIYYCCT